MKSQFNHDGWQIMNSQIRFIYYFKNFLNSQYLRHFLTFHKGLQEFFYLLNGNLNFFQ